VPGPFGPHGLKQQGAPGHESGSQTAVTRTTSVTRASAIRLDPGAVRPPLPVDAYTSHAGATAASLGDEQRTPVRRGALRALAAAGVSASKERLAECDPCADIDAAAVVGMRETGETRALASRGGQPCLCVRAGIRGDVARVAAFRDSHPHRAISSRRNGPFSPRSGARLNASRAGTTLLGRAGSRIAPTIQRCRVRADADAVSPFRQSRVAREGKQVSKT
jgi:hypothetical protein